MTAGSLVARNFLALGSGEMVSRVIAFTVTVYLARILGAEDYGVIALAVGVTLYLSKIADFSIEVIGTNELAKATNSINQLASAIMSVRLVLAALLTKVAILGALFFLSEPERTIMSLYFLLLILSLIDLTILMTGFYLALPIKWIQWLPGN